jgi:hypothetical protein
MPPFMFWNMRTPIMAKRNNKSLITLGGDTVRDAQARQVIQLVDSGMPLAQAEQQVGVTLASLRVSGHLHRVVRSLLEQAEEAGIVEEINQKKVARARLMELALQDDDLKVAVNAAGKMADTGSVKTQVNVQNNVQNNITNPEVLKALKSIGLLMGTVVEGEVIE